MKDIYPYHPELEQHLPKDLQIDLAAFKEALQHDEMANLGEERFSLERSIFFHEYRRHISAEQAYYLRLRYVGYQEDEAKVIKEQQLRRDKGIVEIWAGTGRIAVIPSRYKVSPVSSTYTNYTVTPPWMIRHPAQAIVSTIQSLSQIASLPRDWRLWTCKGRQFLCIRFGTLRKSPLHNRYVPVKTRPSTPEDQFLP